MYEVQYVCTYMHVHMHQHIYDKARQACNDLVLFQSIDVCCSLAACYKQAACSGLHVGRSLIWCSFTGVKLLRVSVRLCSLADSALNSSCKLES